MVLHYYSNIIGGYIFGLSKKNGLFAIMDRQATFVSYC
jgi:hypothetical protein